MSPSETTCEKPIPRGAGWHEGEVWTPESGTDTLVVYRTRE